MTPFLHNLAEQLNKTYGAKISDLCIVFPSRRAGIYFKKYLSEIFKKPIWSPAIYSIEDFIKERSQYIIADDLTLIFELYAIVKKYGETESFDRFYPWGTILLKDFDEIDKNLVNADELFRVIREFKDVESDFSLPFEDLEQFKKFWRTFSNRKLNDVQNNFLKIWNTLSEVYIDFRKALSDNNIAYEGMAVRKLCEDIGEGKIVFNDFEKIIFAGFNSFSKCEIFMINKLLKDGIAEIFWDADTYYVKDNYQEAGKFLRTNFTSLNISSPNWIAKYLIDKEKNIEIFGAPLNVGQVKSFGDKLDELINSNKLNLERSAVILPDESLLLPVLYSIPSEVKKINVTMGFPFRNTVLFNLIDLLKHLQLNKKSSERDFVYYHKDVTEILMHPYIRISDPAYVFKVVNFIKRYSIIYLTGKKITERNNNSNNLIQLLFNPVSSVENIFNYIYQILNIVSARTESIGEYSKYEIEYFYSLYEQLNLLKDIISKYSENIGEEVFWNILTESLNNVKIPFTGEPFEGLQIMGLLESRALDFENVFLLSMNEGIMPKGNTHNSFIPYNLRKVFKLSTYEDTDSISAYYFYRLIQRAKNVYLFYNTESGAVYSNEKSRFLLQVETELALNPNINVKSYIVQASVEGNIKKSLSVSKTPAIIDSLKNEKHYSATDIINYISCKMKFYFKKIAGLEEEDVVEEYFSPSTFGRIFHSIMQNLYSPFKGKLIDENVINDLKRKLNSEYDSIFNDAINGIDELKEMGSHPMGKNLLLKNVLRKLAVKVLDNELKEVPFKLINTEVALKKELSFELYGEKFSIDLFGRIDRVDEKDGNIRILDYKTGNFKAEGKTFTNDIILDKCFTDPKYKESFQAGFYGYLYLSIIEASNIKLGIYPIKKLDDGISFIDNIDLTKDGMIKFENKIKNLFKEIFDNNLPFTQTGDIERCKFCPYISMCYRE